MERLSRRQWIPLLASAPLLAACGRARDPHSLEIPRGSPIPVTLSRALSVRNNAGDPVAAALETQFARGTQVFIAAGAPVEGVVEEVSLPAGGPASIRFRLTRLHLADGRTVEIETEPLVRTGDRGVGARQDLPVTAGLEATIDRLAGETAPGGGAAAASAAGLLALGEGTQLVFTLRSTCVIPPPQ